MGGGVSEDEGRAVRRILRAAGERDASHIDTAIIQDKVVIRVLAPTVGFSDELQRAIGGVFKGSVVKLRLV